VGVAFKADKLVLVHGDVALVAIVEFVVGEVHALLAVGT